MYLAQQILIIFWATLVGGFVGSFLNVVAYRVPLGLSIIEPPSFCPKCKESIRWYDNIPVLGWFLLWGKCRFCKAPISPRYPAVEALGVLMFGMMTLVEFGMKGINLPNRGSGASFWEVFKSNTADADYYLFLIYHLVLLTVLFCGWLCELNGFRPPAKMYGWTIAFGLVFPLQWRFLRPVKAWQDAPLVWTGVIDGLAGLAAGGIFGYIVWRVQRTKQPGSLPLGLACLGAFLGWQAVLPVGIAAVVLGLLGAVILRNKEREPIIPASAWLWGLTLIWILFWSPLALILHLT
jgi:leader peptidase (prepilin peptidase)/N-methyltransferase